MNVSKHLRRVFRASVRPPRPGGFGLGPRPGPSALRAVRALRVYFQRLTPAFERYSVPAPRLFRRLDRIRRRPTAYRARRQFRLEPEAKLSMPSPRARRAREPELLFVCETARIASRRPGWFPVWRRAAGQSFAEFNVTWISIRLKKLSNPRNQRFWNARTGGVWIQREGCRAAGP